MGGERSGCDETTTDVLIESALWEPLNIAHTGRKLGINSDARHRFERGVDPAFMVPGLELATAMVLDLCGGTPTRDHRRRRGAASRRPSIDFPVAEVKRLAGIDPSISRGHARSSTRSASPAKPHRTDGRRSPSRCRPGGRTSTMKADLVEEIVRIVGVDKVPVDAAAARRRRR